MDTPKLQFGRPLRLRMTIVSRDAEGLVIPPRTKKNSAQLFGARQTKDGRRIPPRLVPSEDYLEWLAGCRRTLPDVVRRLGDVVPIARPVKLTATVFRSADVGDLYGYLQAIADLLQANLARRTRCRGCGRSLDVDGCCARETCGYRGVFIEKPLRVLADDKWIKADGGSLLAKDAARPRIEIVLEELP